MSSLSARESQEVERAYVAHRSSVLAMLRAQFRGVHDPEELYQEAWTEALELRARGERISNLGGLLRTIAWRRARDRLRNKSADAVDPASAVLAGLADPAASPEEQAQVRLDAAALRQVVESLDARQAAAIKLRFDEHLSAREIQARLGVSPKRLEKIVTEAYQQVAEQLGDQDEAVGSPWRRRQRSLLVACELGVASSRQRRVARRMVDEDAVCRAMLREIRSTLGQIAAVLPLPAVTHPRLRLIGQLRDSVGERFAALRDGTADLAGRLTGHTSTVEQAAGGAAGLGVGAAVKATLVCMLAAGGTVVCIETNPFGHPDRPAPREQRHDASTVTSSPARVRTTTASVRRTSQTASTNASAPAAPSPAPQGGSEFGTGAIGSSTASSIPAAAPTGGGGEFGP